MKKNSAAEEAKKQGPVYEVKAINKSGETYTLAPIVTKGLGFDHVMEEVRNSVGYKEGDVVISARLINDGDFPAYDTDIIGRFISIKLLAQAGEQIIDHAGDIPLMKLYSAYSDPIRPPVPTQTGH